MRTIHYGLLKAMFPGLVMVAGGAVLKWFMLQGVTSQVTPIPGGVVWRLMGVVFLGLSSGLTTLRFYPLARDEKFMNDLGRGMNQAAFLLMLPTVVLLYWKDWLEMSQALIGGGGIIFGWAGITFIFAVIGEAIFRFSQKY